MANSKSFLEQYSTPDETKYQDGICISRTSSKISFTIKSIFLHKFVFTLAMPSPSPGSPAPMFHRGLTSQSMDIGCGRHQLLVGLKSRLWSIPKVARLTLKLSVNTCRIFDIVHWKMSCDNIPLGPFESPPLKFSVIVISEMITVAIEIICSAITPVQCN